MRYPLLLALGLAALAARAAAAEPFRLADGDRVVLLGGGVIEQERDHGFLEARLTAHDPVAKVTFRNLGWGGDTVRGSARTGGYQNPEGLARLLKEVQDLKPTVLVLGYGMNESFDGPAGLAGFTDAYDRLLDKLAPLKARTVLLSPTAHEDLGRPFPDPAEHNRHLEQYTAAVKALATKRGARFVDLFRPMWAARPKAPQPPLTTNGIQLTAAGYALAARAMEEQLGYPPRAWRVELDRAGKVTARDGATVEAAAAVAGGVTFRATDTVLPAAGDTRRVRVTGLAPGEYTLKVDGKALIGATAAAWDTGVDVPGGPAKAAGEALRAAIVRRNGLFYRRWRPFNDHSRHWGFMKGDYALYDQEIAAQEAVIARLRRPRPHTYEIVAQEGTK